MLTRGKESNTFISCCEYSEALPQGKVDTSVFYSMISAVAVRPWENAAEFIFQRNERSYDNRFHIGVVRTSVSRAASPSGSLFCLSLMMGITCATLITISVY